MKQYLQSSQNQAQRSAQIVAVTTVLLLAAALWMPMLMHAGMQSDGAMASDQIGTSDWSARTIIGTSIMWLLMMLAMMLPSMTPMISAYTGIAAQEDTGLRLTARIFLFIAGYFALWGLFSIAAALLQLALRSSPWFSADGTTATPIAAGVLTLLAGAYQLTPIKDVCLRHCRSPITYLLAHWRGGMSGAFQVGLHHSRYCVGCCGVFMALMFVFGTMTVWWMATMAVYFVAEKLLPRSEIWSRHVGIALLAAGALTIVYALTRT